MESITVLMGIIQLASQAAPVVTGMIAAIKSQNGKSEDEILVDIGVTTDRAEAKALALLAKVLADQQKGTPNG